MTTPSTPEPDEPTRATEPAQPSEPSEADKAEELRAFNIREQDSAWRAVAYLLTGPLIYGGLGAIADHLAGDAGSSGRGSCGGMALSLYLIWFRYGTH